MIYRVYRCLVLCVLGIPPALVCSAQSSISDKAVRAKVYAVKSGSSDIERAAAAEDLFDTVKGRDLDRVHSQTIKLVSDLLSSDSDGVRIWIAATLGEFRGRALFSAPRLMKALKEVECRRVDASSAFTIRTALSKMGKNVPDSDCQK
jgi:hypothetical protein